MNKECSQWFLTMSVSSFTATFFLINTRYTYTSSTGLSQTLFDAKLSFQLYKLPLAWNAAIVSAACFCTVDILHGTTSISNSYSLSDHNSCHGNHFRSPLAISRRIYAPLMPLISMSTTSAAIM